MDKNKVKKFIKEHETEIAYCIGVAAGIVTGYAVTAHCLTKQINYLLCEDRKYNLLNELISARSVSANFAWNNGFEKYTLADFGKVGEDVIRVSDGLLKPSDVTTGILLYTK